MTNATPDYKKLYEQSQKRLREVEAEARKKFQKELKETVLEITRQYEQKLHLALLEANGLRAKLFGIKSDNRVKKANEDQLELFSLGASPQALDTSEQQFQQEVQEEEKSKKQPQKREKGHHAMPPGWYCRKTSSVKK